MITFREYKKVDTLEEAWQLNQKRANRIVGGMLWLKMSSQSLATAIDLSGLGLDTIEETDREFRIGAMVTLRQLETHKKLNNYTGGAVAEAVRHIVGVQFRNMATVGGSVYGRYGFSDVLTVLLAMDSYVELYKGGTISLSEYAAQQTYDRDVLVRVIVKKPPAKYYYQSVRNTQTDFPVLTCAAAMTKQGLRLAVGGRPGRAIVLPMNAGLSEAPANREDAELFAAEVAKLVPTGSNLRGSAEYRTHLAQVLAFRAAVKLGGIETC